MIKALLVFPLLFIVLSQGEELTSKQKPYYDTSKAMDHFLEFVKKYDKVYEPGEAAERFKNFADTLELINKRNKADSATHGINGFADVTEGEFAKVMLGKASKPPRGPQPFKAKEDFKAPTSIDWRDHNVVTRVKDQGRCSCAYAFAFVGSFEGVYALQTRNLTEFSEQEILDCSNRDQCDLFNGLSLASGKGMETEADYPYTGKKGKCNIEDDKIVAKTTSAVGYWVTESYLALAVVEFGPAAVTICGKGLRTYKSGIWQGTECPAEDDLNHCIENGHHAIHFATVVGYGVDDQQYWLLKNSWGTGWGEEGYFKMRRGDQVCSIGTFNSIVATFIVSNK